jgi:two-component system, OmpR family, response regulator
MHISIVDDEKILGSKIKKKLEYEWFAVSKFDSYDDFMTHGSIGSQLYIIDISLGDGSGFDIITRLRTQENCRVPILIVSGYVNSDKIIYGLNIGADDYLAKPFVPDELIARVRALLRRPASIIPPILLRYKDITFNPDTNEAKIWDTRVYLNHKESMVLEFFLKQQKQIMSRDMLVATIWGPHHLNDVSDNTINSTLSKLRKKIWTGLHLRTVYGHGYILE